MENSFDNIKKRKVTDELVLEGRTFKLKKFDPLTGNYILMQIITLVLPLGIGDMLNGEMGTEMLPKKSSNAQMMGKKEFIELQKDILTNVYEVLPAGETQVVRENGTYGVENFTGTICLQLLIACLAFNFADFFADGVLGSLTTSSLNS